MKTKTIQIGKVSIGGGNPVAIQSMANADTKDTEAVLKQINALENIGCEIMRVAAYDIEAAKNIQAIKEKTDMPIVADVHFDYKIAIAAIEAGADKVRINPGNIGESYKIKAVADAAKMHHIPIRVGANTGSLAKDYLGHAPHEALVMSAMENIRALEKQGFYDIVVSLKSSHVPDMVQAYRSMQTLCEYPLHLGVTEAGLYASSIVKSSMGIGALLLDGIGDTIRVSVTGSLAEEVTIAKDILRYAGLRKFGPEIISCPTCARTQINLEQIAKEVSEKVSHIKKPLKIAVMGCAVNGPGEAKGCDFGIAGGKGEGVLFQKGKLVKKVPDYCLVDELLNLIERDSEKDY